MIGSEGTGISDELLPYINLRVSIPRIGKAESLNAGVACGILLHLMMFDPIAIGGRQRENGVTDTL